MAPVMLGSRSIVVGSYWVGRMEVKLSSWVMTVWVFPDRKRVPWRKTARAGLAATESMRVQKMTAALGCLRPLLILRPPLAMLYKLHCFHPSIQLNLTVTPFGDLLFAETIDQQFNYKSQEAMASILKSLLQIHKLELEQQKQQSSLSSRRMIERDRCQRSGESILDAIIQLLADQEGVADLVPLKMGPYRSDLLSKLAKKHQTDESTLERAMGLFLRDTFSKNIEFIKLKQQFQMVFEELQQSDSDIDSNEEDQIHETVYSAHSEYLPSKIHSQSMRSDFSLVDKWNSEIEKGSNHHDQIIQYLAQLASPQSELTYLCQHFGWRSAYEGGIPSLGSFEVSAVVGLEYKNIKKQLRESGSGANKKIARMFAAAKMLKKIYLSFPHLWNMFSKIKEEKGIVMLSCDLSSSILNASMMSENVDIVRAEPQKIQFVLAGHETDEYLSQICNFKSEMNLLLQQLPTSFDHPKMQKTLQNNKWKVQGQLRYQHEKDAEMVYRSVQISSNSKKGEHDVAKRLLTKMFEEHPQIVQIMSMIKIKKGIKT